MSLANLGLVRRSLRRFEAACKASRKAVAIYRELAAERPDAFLPSLAMSLTNLVMLADQGGCGGGLAAGREVVTLYRGLANRRPEAFRPDLAMSLNNLGLQLRSRGEDDESLAAIQEAVALYRDLADRQPAAFVPELALALGNVASGLLGVGRGAEAFRAVEDALRSLLPAYRDSAPAPAPWIKTLAGLYLRLVLRTGEAPSQDLLGPVVEAVQAADPPNPPLLRRRR